MQDASFKQQTKQKYKPNHKQTGLPPHSALAIRGKINKQTKNSAQISPCTKLTQTTGPTLERQKPKGRKNSALKPGKRRPQTHTHKNSEKAEKYYRNEGKSRNTEVQINEEEIGKLPEKEFRIMIVKMFKNLENTMEKNAIDILIGIALNLKIALGSNDILKILSLHYQRNANQNHNEVPSHTSQNGCYQKV